MASGTLCHLPSFIAKSLIPAPADASTFWLAPESAGISRESGKCEMNVYTNGAYKNKKNANTSDSKHNQHN